MGQNNTYHTNPMFQDWQQHPTQPKIYINVTQGTQAESIIAILSNNEQIFLRKRLQQNINYVAKILYYKPFQRNNKYIVQDNRYYIYLQKLYPVTSNTWIPITSTLSILKGFRRLASLYGMMRVTPGMIHMNNKKQIRVWIHQDLIKCQPSQSAQNQQTMLADIIKIVMQYDHNTGILMANCQKIFDAINNILKNMAQNNTQMNLSNRTNQTKNEDKSKSMVKDIPINFGNTVNMPNPNQNPIINKFRSTKQTTEDDELKPFNEKNFNFIIKKQKQTNLNTITVQNNKNYLQNVARTKSPKYINVDNKQVQIKNLIPVGIRNYESQSNSCQYNYSQPNNPQKQSSIQFNNSHPIKMATDTRPYKPIEYKNQNMADSLKSYSNTNPSYEKIKRDHDRYTQKYTQLMHSKISPYTYFPQRKSNINKNYLQRLQNSQDNDILQNRNKNTININQKSQINTSRDFIEYHSFNRPRNMDLNSYYDASRTKTQQFYSNHEFQPIGCSPRNRTNYFQSSQLINKSPIAHTNINLTKPTYNPTFHQPANIPTQDIQFPLQFQRPLSQKSQSQAQKHSQCNQEYKKQIKIKQAKTIKQEMTNLGIQGLTKPLRNEKSTKDLLIKKKIEQKNKKHEDLKCAITTLLNR